MVDLVSFQSCVTKLCAQRLLTFEVELTTWTKFDVLQSVCIFCQCNLYTVIVHLGTFFLTVVE